MVKTIDQNDTIYEELKYDWMPTRQQLEQKRLTEGLPEKAREHVLTSNQSVKMGFSVSHH